MFLHPLDLVDLRQFIRSVQPFVVPILIPRLVFLYRGYTGGIAHTYLWCFFAIPLLGLLTFFLSSLFQFFRSFFPRRFRVMTATFLEMAF